jgi:SAM-dependent methyltransferase
MSDPFDPYKHTYREEVQRAIGFAGQDLDFFTDLKARLLAELAERTLGNPSRLSVLDVGCGVGLTDSALVGRFASLDGVDVSEGAVEEAAAANPDVGYAAYDGRTLPYADDVFDMAFAICVLHHVDRAARADFVREMRRVVRPGGLLVAIEHNPFNPLTRAAVSRCEFDDGVRLLRRGEVRGLFASSGLEPVGFPYILLFPWRAEMFRRVEGWLSWLPLGAQYLAAGRKARTG